MNPYQQRLRAAGAPANSHDNSTDWETRAIRALDASRKASTNAGFRIERPGTAASLIPVIGPAWEAAADIQDGDYGSAALNGAFAVADALPFGFAAKVARVMKVLKRANGGEPLSSLSAKKLAELYKKAGLKKPGEHLHHTVPLNEWGILPKASRSTPGLLRNHPALLKVMSPSVHQLAHGNKGAGLAGKVWHGSNALEKGVAGSMVGRSLDAGEAAIDRKRPSGPPRAR